MTGLLNVNKTSQSSLLPIARTRSRYWAYWAEVGSRVARSHTDCLHLRDWDVRAASVQWSQLLVQLAGQQRPGEGHQVGLVQRQELLQEEVHGPGVIGDTAGVRLGQGVH